MNNRLLWADILKGFLIILVILGHAIQRVLIDGCYSNHLWNIIYSFHMPAFMAVSGYLSYGKNKTWTLNKVGECLLRRFKQLIIPFSIWSIIFVLINKDIVVKEFVNIVLYPDSGLWFLWALFFINVIFVLSCWMADVLKKKREVLVLLACVILVTVMVFLEPRMFGFQFVSYYFLFFSLGYFINEYKESVRLNRLCNVLLIIIWAFLAWNWKMQEVPSFLHGVPLPNSLLQYAYRFITASIAIVIILINSEKFFNGSGSSNAIIASVGVVSLGIYTTHYVLLWKCVDIMKKLTQNEVLLIIATFTVLLFLSFALVKLFSLSKVLSKKLLGKI